MEALEKYFNFIRNYNKKLKEKGAEWLGAADLGEVIVQTAQQNIDAERGEK